MNGTRGGGDAGRQHQARPGDAHFVVEDQAAGDEVAQIGQEPGQEETVRRAQRTAIQRVQDRHAQDAHHPERPAAGRAPRILLAGQRGEEVQPHDHVQVPEVVIRFALDDLARPEGKVDAPVVPPVQPRAPRQVEQSPEHQRRADARHATAIELEGVLGLVGIQQQCAADHDKDRHAPARRRVIHVGGQPRTAAVGGWVADD
ncbi:hypothetical protein G6F68_013838 [Rhizopus microsporus]|nr:hypothetical protein G6F68_013838 [Rhizopus microsporus]